MHYFVTGGTGFIGRFLVPRLLERGGTVHVLVRPGSEPKLEALRVRLGVSKQRLRVVKGDLRKRNLGVAPATIKRLHGLGIAHFFHLAAIYDIAAPAQEQIDSNVTGTEQAVDLARKLGAGCFHHVSSIAAAGLYQGSFTEVMLEEAGDRDNPYFRTKHDAEVIVRGIEDMAYRIYRPGIVVGDSYTGEIDKIDGPYFFFPIIKTLGDSLPSWMRSLVFAGGKLNIVPVDYVVEAMDYLAHEEGLDGGCYYLTQEQELAVGELIQILLRTAGGPDLTVIPGEGSAALLGRAGKALGRVPGVENATRRLMEQAGIPGEAMKFMTYPTHFDSTATRAILDPAGIVCPEFEEYAGALWDYWLNDLDEPPAPAHSMQVVSAFRAMAARSLQGQDSEALRKAVRGQVVMVTGATSGIGHEAALKLASAGAIVLLVARTVEKLRDTENEIADSAGKAYSYRCDLADGVDCDHLVERVLSEHGRVDILINNAGRSIRRSVESSFDRYHDFERTMQLNYFGSLKLILGFTPGMLQRGRGQIINISSIGVLASPPRFSAYVASKAALDAFSWCAAAEFAHRKVQFTTINMPLVKTPMIAPTRLYDAFPTLTPEQAATLIMKAIVAKPKRVATSLGLVGAVAQALAPNSSEFVLNQAYHLFPDSAAAAGAEAEEAMKARSPKDIARQLFAQVLPGVALVVGDTMQPLSDIDALFLNLDTRNTPMHIGSLSIYDQSKAPGGFLRFTDILAYYRSRLDRAKVFRRRRVNVPFNLGNPYWIEDPEFDIEFHIRHIALPEPRDWRQLTILAARLFSRPLDLNKPLWEVYVIEGLDSIEGIAPNSFALLHKVHHSAVDGVSGAELLAATHELGPDYEIPATPRYDGWQADSVPSDLAMYLNGLIQSTRMPGKYARYMRNFAGRWMDARQWLQGGHRSLQVAPDSPFNQGVTPHRVFDGVRFPLERIKAVKNSVEGCTVNDVIIAICGGGMYKYLASREEGINDSLLAMMPKSTRSEAAMRDEGNQISIMRVAIGSHIEDARERLEFVRDSTHDAKELLSILGEDVVAETLALISPAVANLTGKVLMATGLSESVRMFNTVVTNVPGPPVPLYFMGCEMQQFYGMGPAASGLGLFQVVFSYNGIVSIGCVSCREMMPDPAFYASCLEEAYQEMLELD